MITGDIVYGKGLISEYRNNFWPIYNADAASPSGRRPPAPLDALPRRSRQSRHRLARPGEDSGWAGVLLLLVPAAERPGRGRGKPARRAGRRSRRDQEGVSRWPPARPSPGWRTSRSTTATPTGPSSTPTRPSTGPTRAPGMGRRATSQAAKGARWRFVSFHQPGFSSSKTHFNEQYMRILAPVFEAGKVDLVFNGHVHNYQRTYPMTFVPATENGAKPVMGPDGKLCQDRGASTANGRSTRRSTASPTRRPKA